MRLLLLLSLCLLTIASCDIINPDEQTPAFIEINSIDLVTAEDGSEGSDSQNFSDAWIYSGGQLIGTFELPATFPILAEGMTQIDVYAGIKENGISSTRLQYGFLDSDVFQLDLVPAEVVSISPVVHYLEDILQFELIDFESALIPEISEVGTAGLDLELIENSDPSLDYLGAGYGRIQLNDTIEVYRLLTTLDLNLAVEDFAFLELDYNTTVPFVVGLRVESPLSNEIIMAGVNPTITANGSHEWKKIYINIGSFIDLLPQGFSYEIVVVGNSVNETGTTLLDNFKIVYPD